MESENIFNITAIKNLMGQAPKGQRLYNFFSGAADQITNEQKKNLYIIIKDSSNSILNYILKNIGDDNGVV